MAKKPTRKRRRVGRLTPGAIVVPSPGVVVPPRPVPVRPVPVPVRPRPGPVPVVPPRPGPRPVVPVLPPPQPGGGIVSLRQRGEAIVKEAQRLGGEIATGFYRLGLLLRELSQPDMVKEMGYATFHELVEDRDITTRMNAYRLLSVVDAYEQGVAEKLGVEKSYAVIRYASLAQPGAKAMAVLANDPVLQLPGRILRLSAARARDVYEAIRRMRHVALPDAYKKRVQKASRGISQRLERVDIHSARVRSIQRGQRMVVRIEVDGEEASRLLALLGRR